MKKEKLIWIKTEIFNGVQTIWSVEGKDISITRDHRTDMDNGNYPYAVHVNNQYHGHYHVLAIAKKDALIYADPKFVTGE